MAKVSIIICNRQKTFSKCNKKPKAVLFSDKKEKGYFYWNRVRNSTISWKGAD